MKASELKYDNYIIGTYESEDDNLIHETICKFKFYDCYSNYYHVESKDNITDFSGFKPIELTEEILLKCGFVKELWKDKTQTYYLFNGIIVILKDDYYENGAIFYRNTLLFEEKLNLHQLQNLYFALKNEELTINL